MVQLITPPGLNVCGGCSEKSGKKVVKVRVPRMTIRTETALVGSKCLDEIGEIRTDLHRVPDHRTCLAPLSPVAIGLTTLGIAPSENEEKHPTEPTLPYPREIGQADRPGVPGPAGGTLPVSRRLYRQP